MIDHHIAEPLIPLHGSYQDLKSCPMAERQNVS